MKYQKIKVDIKPSEVGVLTGLLCDLNINGYEIIDDEPVDNPFDFDYEELKPVLPDLSGMASVIFYLNENDNPAPFTEEIQKTLPMAKFSISISDEADWRDKWKDYFHSFTISDILIKPSWESVDKDIKAKTVIEIDPGISFGTGAHETTRMCIGQLGEIDLNGKKVLDAGCGSGILSIAANKLGSKDITCIDIDADCIVTTKENLNKNHCDISDFTFFTGDIMSNKHIYDSIPDDSYDVVCANILADIIVKMLGHLTPKIKKGGCIITSGIIAGKEALVQKALEDNGFIVEQIKQDGEWFMIRGRR